MKHYSSYLLLFIFLVPSTHIFSSKRKKSPNSLETYSLKKKQRLRPIDRLNRAIENNNLQSARNIIALQPLSSRSNLLNSLHFQTRVPLELACKKGSLRMVSLLLEYGSDPNKTSSHRCTPMLTAIKRGAPNIVLQLLVNGAHSAHPETTVSLLNTSINLYHKKPACYYNIITLLLKHGADPLKLSHQKKSTLEHALYLEDKKVAHLMEKYVSKTKEAEINTLLIEQPNDLLTEDPLTRNALSSLIVLNGRIWTKNSLMKHVLYKIGTVNGPRDPFTNKSISRKTLVRLAAHTRIPIQEIDRSQKNPNYQSLLEIAKSLTKLENDLSIWPSVTEQEKARLLKNKFNRRLRKFNPELATSVYAS